MWNTFHKTWIYALMIFVVGCSGCAMFGGDESPTDVAHDMSEDCKNGPKHQRIEYRKGETESVDVFCADPPK